MSLRPRNDDLPILGELGDHLGDAFRREERAEGAKKHRRRLRRVAIATAALFVVVPGAVATRYIWAPGPASHPGAAFESSRAVQIAEGRAGRVTWRLSAAVTKTDGLCWQAALYTATENYGRGSSCVGQSLGAPLGLSVSHAAGETIAFGWLDPRAARVVVDPRNGEAPKAARIVKAPADRVKAAGLPAGTQAYIVGFASDLESAPPSAVAFDAAGRELGRMPPRR